jgi:hypothetical protein
MILLVLGSMHYKEFVQEGVDALSVLYYFQHQSLLGQWDKGVCHVSHPEKGRLTTRERDRVEVDVNVVGDKADRGILRVLEII